MRRFDLTFQFFPYTTSEERVEIMKQMKRLSSRYAQARSSWCLKPSPEYWKDGKGKGKEFLFWSSLCIWTFVNIWYLSLAKHYKKKLFSYWASQNLGLGIVIEISVYLNYFGSFKNTTLALFYNYNLRWKGLIS